MEIKKSCANCDWRNKDDNYCRLNTDNIADISDKGLDYKCAGYIREKLPTDQSKVAFKKTQSNCNTMNEGGQVNEKRTNRYR